MSIKNKIIELNAKFVYNNAKKANINYTPFELNYGFKSQVLFKEKVEPFFKSYLANKLVDELKELMKIYYQIYSIYRNYKRKLMIKE